MKKNNNQKYFNYHLVIKDQKSIELYFKSKHNISFLTLEEKNNLIQLRKNKYPKYESLKYYKRLEFILDVGLKDAIKDENKDINLFYRGGGKMIPQEKIDIIDLIVLKELQKEEYEKKVKEEQNKAKEEKEKLNKLKEELLKRQKKIVKKIWINVKNIIKS